MRRNIRDILKGDKLEAETRNTQQSEIDRNNNSFPKAL